ncbi:hypothetical protein [Pseudomonas sp.]|uniref:hypothetical protein n=1 Tax=Pseudomonas sp. TaxID=306 RepID=UPI0025894B52|nr:hypothetical protein [Pseudomonas sp.]
MTASQRDRSAKAAKKRKEGDEVELRMWTKPATRTVLAELMEWHGISENAEAMTLALHHLHALGPEGSRPFFTPPRHEIVLSKNVALAFERKSLLMIQKDPGDEVVSPG